MGLLDGAFNSPDAMNALGLLAAAGPRSDGAGFGQRLMEGINAGRAMNNAQMAQQMQQLQLQQAAVKGNFLQNFLGGLSGPGGNPSGGMNPGNISPFALDQSPRTAPGGNPQPPSPIGVGANQQSSSRIASMTPDQLVALEMAGGKDYFPMWKALREGVNQQPGYVMNLATGKREYLGDPQKGVSLDDAGNVVQMPGATDALGAIAQAQKAGELRGANSQTLAPIDRINPLTNRPYDKTVGQLVDSVNGNPPAVPPLPQPPYIVNSFPGIGPVASRTQVTQSAPMSAAQAMAIPDIEASIRGAQQRMADSKPGSPTYQDAQSDVQDGMAAIAKMRGGTSVQKALPLPSAPTAQATTPQAAPNPSINKFNGFAGPADLARAAAQVANENEIGTFPVKGEDGQTRQVQMTKAQFLGQKSGASQSSGSSPFSLNAGPGTSAQSIGIAESPTEAAQNAAAVQLKTKPNIDYATQASQEFQKMGGAINSNLAEAQALLQRITQSREAMKNFQSGGGAETRMQLAKLAQSIPGVPTTIVDKIAGGDLSSLQEFQKYAAQEALQTMRQSLSSDDGGKGSQGNRVAMQLFIANNPNIDTDPRAVEKIFNFQTDLHNDALAKSDAFLKYKNDPANAKDPIDFGNYWAHQQIGNGRVVPEIVTGNAKGTQQATISPAQTSVTPPLGAVNFLKMNPSKAADFDAKYGAGAAKAILGK